MIQWYSNTKLRKSNKEFLKIMRYFVMFLQFFLKRLDERLRLQNCTTYNQSSSVSFTSTTFTGFCYFLSNFQQAKKLHLFIRYDIFLCFCYDTNNFYYFHSESKKKLSVNLQCMKEIFLHVTFIYSYYLYLYSSC